MTAIRTRALVKEYRTGRRHVVRALDRVDLDVAEGEFIALLGRSGSGRSTLLNVIGGLGSAVARTLALRAPTPVEMVGVQDRFGESGTWKQLLERHGLTAAGVGDAVRRVLARK